MELPTPPVPPIVLPEPPSMRTPEPPFPNPVSPCVPGALTTTVAMEFLITVLPWAPDPEIVTPSPPFPAMTLKSRNAVPPTVLSDTPSRRTPLPVFPLLE
jgi:hypothetical protein